MRDAATGEAEEGEGEGETAFDDMAGALLSRNDSNE
jgi:hypothetical protein